MALISYDEGSVGSNTNPGCMSSILNTLSALCVQILFGKYDPNHIGGRLLFYTRGTKHMHRTPCVTSVQQSLAYVDSPVLAGKYLEASAKGRTSDAITALLTLTPPSALLLTLGPEGEVTGEEEVSTALIHRGDFLKVPP